MTRSLRISPDLALPTRNVVIIRASAGPNASQPMTLGHDEVVFAIERILARTEERGDCWVFTGSTKNGYGILSIRQRHVYIHRLVHVIVTGESVDGFDVCHRCDNPPCWRPAHLFRGTRQQNVADAQAKGRAVNPPRVTGLRQHLARLTDDEVAEIRAAWEAGGVDQRTLASAHGCSQSTIWRLVNGKVRV